MKQKDIALIIVVIGISSIISLYVSKAIFASPKNRQQQVEVVQPITADFPQPDARYINANSTDPTSQITIQQNANTQPFSGTSQ